MGHLAFSVQRERPMSCPRTLTGILFHELKICFCCKHLTIFVVNIWQNIYWNSNNYEIKCLYNWMRFYYQKCICIMIIIYTWELLYCIDTTEMWKSMALVDYKICAWYLELKKETWNWHDYTKNSLLKCFVK